jgi:NADH-quinone oxidoreductase subunit C
MTEKEIHKILLEKFADRILSFAEDAKDPFIVVAPDAIKPVMRFLKEDPHLQFDFLSCITGIDFPENITVVYHLFSYKKRHKIVIKAQLPKDKPEIETVEDVWKAANWLERETYDLLGIRFIGNSNLRRILLPEDWVGHPLRKDYVQPEEYHGWSNQ